MALNIAVTSKFDPFTQEDYIKPLANYWKEYEKYENDIFQEKLKLAAFEPYEQYFDKVADKKLLEQYNKFKEGLNDAADTIAQNGLNASTKRSLREEIFPSYYSQMQPLMAAMQKKEKDIAEYQKQLETNPGNLYSKVNPMSAPVSTYYGVGAGPIGYFQYSKSDVSTTAGNFAAAYSSSLESKSESEDPDTGQKVFTTTTGGGVRPDVGIQDDKLTFASGVTDKVKKAISDEYEQMKKDFRYDEMDLASQSQFNNYFTDSINQYWVSKSSENRHRLSSADPRNPTGNHIKIGEDIYIEYSDGSYQKQGSTARLTGAQMRSLEANYQKTQTNNEVSVALYDSPEKLRELLTNNWTKNRALMVDGKPLDKLYGTPSVTGRYFTVDFYWNDFRGGKDGEFLTGEVINDGMNITNMKQLGEFIFNNLDYSQEGFMRYPDDGDRTSIYLVPSELAKKAMNARSGDVNGEKFVVFNYRDGAGDNHVLGVSLQDFYAMLNNFILSGHEYANQIQVDDLLTNVSSQTGIDVDTLKAGLKSNLQSSILSEVEDKYRPNVLNILKTTYADIVPLVDSDLANLPSKSKSNDEVDFSNSNPGSTGL